MGFKEVGVIVTQAKVYELEVVVLVGDDYVLRFEVVVDQAASVDVSYSVKKLEEDPVAVLPSGVFLEEPVQGAAFYIFHHDGRTGGSGFIKGEDIDNVRVRKAHCQAVFPFEEVDATGGGVFGGLEYEELAGLFGTEEPLGEFCEFRIPSADIFVRWSIDRGKRLADHQLKDKQFYVNN